MQKSLKVPVASIVLFAMTVLILLPGKYTTTVVEYCRYLLLLIEVLILVRYAFFRRKLPAFVIGIIAFYSVVGVADLINGVEISLGLLKTIVFLIVHFILASFELRKRSTATIYALFFAFSILALWDVAGILTHPDGLYSAYQLGIVDFNSAQWMYGNKNNHTQILLLFLLTTTWLDSIKRTLYSKLLVVANCILCCITALVLQSSTTIICILFFSVFILLYETIGFKVSLKGKTIIIGYLILLFVIVMGQTGFLGAAAHLFGKDLTFSGRIFVWSKSIVAIMQKPILGHGHIEGSYYLRSIIGSVNPHNTILGAMFYGGIILTVLYFWFYVELFHICSTLDSRDHTFLSQVFLLAILIKTLFEDLSINQQAFFYLFVVFLFMQSKKENGFLQVNSVSVSNS